MTIPFDKRKIEVEIIDLDNLLSIDQDDITELETGIYKLIKEIPEYNLHKMMNAAHKKVGSTATSVSKTIDEKRKTLKDRHQIKQIADENRKQYSFYDKNFEVSLESEESEKSIDETELKKRTKDAEYLDKALYNDSLKQSKAPTILNLEKLINILQTTIKEKQREIDHKMSTKKN